MEERKEEGIKRSREKKGIFRFLIRVVSIYIVKTKLLTFKQLIGLPESQPCGRADRVQVDFN